MSYSTTILADTPLAYWKLDETAGATQFTDSSGNNHPATIVGTPTYSSTYKVDTGSAQFNASPYGSVGSAWIGALSSYSIEAWFSTAAGGNQAILFYDNASNSPGNPTRVFQLYLANGQLVFIPLMSSGAYVGVLSPTAVYNDNIWHHVVATWNGTVAKLFLDGAEVASAALSGTTTTGGGVPLLIGAAYFNAPGNSYQFNGSLDEVALYGAALTPTQVTTHYNTGYANFPASNAKIETQYVETMVTGTQGVAAETLYLEALMTGTQGVQVEVQYLEALTLILPANRFVGWGIPR